MALELRNKSQENWAVQGWWQPASWWTAWDFSFLMRVSPVNFQAHLYLPTCEGRGPLYEWIHARPWLWLPKRRTANAVPPWWRGSPSACSRPGSRAARAAALWNVHSADNDPQCFRASCPTDGRASLCSLRPVKISPSPNPLVSLGLPLHGDIGHQGYDEQWNINVLKIN